jgi:DNA-binding response OmpR family regulator
VKNVNIVGHVQNQQTHLLQKRNKIVIVDDDPAILEAMKMILELYNYDVETIGDGDLMSKLISIQPKLLFLDICMSGVDGGDICKSLKMSDATKDIPVIMISASYNLREVTQDSGADDFLAKPFELHDLLSKVNKYLLN